MRAAIACIALACLSCGAAGQTRQSAPTGICFRRVAEPRENAFTILVPAEWRTAGGIVRVNPLTANGAGNAIAAKVDFAVQSDAAGTVMLRALPEMMYADMRRSPAGALFPPGSNYNGMTVMPLMDAASFLVQVAFRYAHPRAAAPRVSDRRPLPQLAQQYAQRLRASGVPLPFRYDAAVITVDYQEGGAAFQDRLFTAIEDMSPSGANLWSNKETLLVRTPSGEFAKWAPLLSVVQSSVKMNPQWVLGEMRGQMQRGETAMRVQRDLQALDRQIAEHRRRTVSEINNDMFLTLTSQEEYVNPHTKEVETGSNQWKHRWVGPNGDVVYSDDPSYDPNHDLALNRTGFARSQVRPRQP